MSINIHATQEFVQDHVTSILSELSKKAETENGIIDVFATPLQYNEISVFNKEGGTAKTIEEAHTGVFKGFGAFVNGSTGGSNETTGSHEASVLIFQTHYKKETAISYELVKECVYQTMLSDDGIIRTRTITADDFPVSNMEWETISTTKTVKDYVDANCEINTINETAEGSTITLTDSADAKLKGLKVCGKTTQMSYNGYQLFDVSQIENEDITVNDDGSISVSLSGFGSTTIDISYVRSSLKLGNLYIKCYAVNDTNLVVLSCATVRITASIGQLTDDAVDTLADGGVLFNFSHETALGDLIGLHLRIADMMYGDDATYTFKIMLYQDGDGTWEPYTGGIASPNPNYPQPLVSVGDGGSVTAKVYGMNLFNPNANNSIGAWGCTYTNNGDTQVITSTSATQYTNAKVDLPDIPIGTKITIYGEWVVSASQTGKLTVAWANPKTQKTTKEIGTINTSGVSSTFILPDKTTEDDILVLIIYNNFNGTVAAGDTITYSKVQVNVGDNASPFEPYKEVQTLTLSTPNGLPSIPVTSGGNYTDDNGQQWICDEIDGARSKYVQRVVVSEVNITSISTNPQYTVDGNTLGIMYFSDKNKIKKNNAGALCSKARHIVNNNIETRVLGTFYENESMLVFIGEVGDTLETIKQKYDGSKLMYILAEPIETDLTEEEISQYKALVTNKTVTNIFNDADAHMKVDYVADPKTYIDNKFANIENAILSLGGNV